MSDFFTNMAGRSRGEGAFLRPLHALYRAGEVPAPPESPGEPREASPIDVPVERLGRLRPPATAPAALPPAVADLVAVAESAPEQTAEKQNHPTLEEPKRSQPRAALVIPGPARRNPITVEPVQEVPPSRTEAGTIAATPAAPRVAAVPHGMRNEPDGATPAPRVRRLSARPADALATLDRPDSAHEPLPPEEAHEAIGLDATLRMEPEVRDVTGPAATARPASPATAEPSARSVTVSIGRLEIKVVAAPPGAKPARQAAPPADGLGDYLRRRAGGGR